MGKTRVGVLFRESVGGGKSTNRSADLLALHKQYDAYCKKLKALIQALQHQNKYIVGVEKSRTEVAQKLAELTKNTPLWDAVGLMPSADRPSHTVCSYSSVHDTLSAKTKSYAQKYKQFVVDYAVEWETIITKRVDEGIKKSEELRRDLDHYQKKVESLRLSVNQAMAKGKNVSSTSTEKLSRNEEKLIHAKQSYNKLATDLCILMEEITERGWRDLHPLLIKVAQFDMTLSGDEAKIMSSLNEVVGKLKQAGSDNGISPQPRLKDLGSLKPELLSTRPGGVAGLQIEADPSAPLFGSSFSNSPPALPPGSVGPQGMGGFPVQVGADFSSLPSPGSYPISRDSSFGSFASAPTPGYASAAPTSFEPPSTLSMLTISQASAPAPTYDDLYAANNSSALTIRSAPSSGNLPPLPPSSSFNRSSRAASADSNYSGGYNSVSSVVSSPPSGPPPLPPNMPPPPPPPMGVNYGASPYGAPPMANAMVMPPPTTSYSPYGSYSSQQPTSPYGQSNTNPFDF